MLELKNVSKFYYSKGMVASGFTKINLKLNIGEFVAITGESGSGKSTLLNVISGLDTYEEGEMYINGEETSGYTEADFEAYRKTYIANIFQNFNLVNSYTVFQNIELMFLMNGFKTTAVKQKILDVIDKVGLTKYKNTKVSKLSGGQKQRVAIARALIKETPIIVADEPTGNLDSKAALEVMKLLSSVAKDKLVIVVTHNYEQVEPYATRKIKMHDGRIIEDKVLKQTTKVEPKINHYKGITKLNKLKLGIRNTFNIVPKFLLLLVVYLFLSLAIISQYSSYKKMNYTASNIGTNEFFRDTSDKRLIIQKLDKTAITDEEYEKIKNIDNVDYIVQNDLLIDQNISVYNDNFYFNGQTFDLQLIDSVDLGRMPENDYEIVVTGNKDSYYLSEDFASDILEKEYTVQNDQNGQKILDSTLKIVGIKYTKNDDYSDKYYMSTNIINEIKKRINSSYSDITIDFNNVIYSPNGGLAYKSLVPNPNVPRGSMYIPEEMNYECKNNSCLNYISVINIKNIYFENSMTLTITKTYNKKNVKNLLNIDDYEETNGSFYVNSDEYYELFNKGNYQSTVYIKNVKIADKTIGEIENLGMKVIQANSLLATYGEVNLLLMVFKIIVTVIVTVALFFISYFIIKIILKSRNIYYSTIRILGATRKSAKQLLDIELITVLNVSYILIIAAVILVGQNIINIPKIKEFMEYLVMPDYIILYLILILLSFILSSRYARKLFKHSAMDTYREEV